MARSDLFALGVMAYELFSDQIPPTSLRDVVRTHTVPRPKLENITPPSRFCPVLPAEVDQVILAMMAYAQNDRPRSAAEVRAVFERAQLRSLDAVLQEGITPAAAESRASRIRVEGGLYYLGAQNTSPMANEKPYCKVQITPFLMEAYPVTNAAYRAFARAMGQPLPPLALDPVFGRDTHPVVAVTWQEARDYARWMGGRLPWEAEWECAARGGTRFAEYPWGKERPTPIRANIDRVMASTTPVDAHPQGCNAFGLYDMCGNVWEWCADVLYDAEWYSVLRHNIANPRNEGTGGPRTLRGGCFESVATTGHC